ncbi:hypothetical protein J4227_07240 [Candidatus Woesearchaeota archaeon]|nr:hypothetical protein [Candidatus Woesearchaeota archaeon]
METIILTEQPINGHILSKEDKMKEAFLDALNTSPLSDKMKEEIRLSFETFEQNKKDIFVSRIFGFFGSTGLGKTYLAVFVYLFGNILL